MLNPDPTYTIEDVWVVLTYPDATKENFKLEAPNGSNPFQFGFRKIPKLEDYRDSLQRWQRGCYFYQLTVTYSYAAHEMDLRKLLIADNIALKFPPAFGQLHNYNEADVLLANESVVKNYLAGLAMASETGEVVPSGEVTLEFEGIDAFTEAQLFSLFGWNQSDVADPDDEDGTDPDDEIDLDEFTVYANYKGAGGVSDNGVHKFVYDADGNITVQAEKLFSEDSLSGGIGHVLVLRNGNMVTWHRNNTTVTLHLFDSDLNYIKSWTDTEPDGQGGYTDEPMTDEDDNIYVVINNGPPGYQTFYKKVDKNLNTVYTSEKISANRGRWLHVAANYIMCMGYGHPNGINTVNVGIFNRDTGALISNFLTSNDYRGSTNLKDGYVALGVLSGGKFDIYDATGTFVKSIQDNLTGMTEQFGTHVLGTKDNQVIWYGDEYIQLIDWENETVIWEVENVVFTGTRTSFSHWNGFEKLIAAGNLPANSTSTGFLQVINILDGSSFVSVTPTLRSGVRYIGLLFDNWQLDYWGVPDTPPPPETPTYQGTIEITGPADDNFEGTAPTATIIVRNSPSQQSDECGTGGTEFNIEYKGTDYCTVLPVASKENIALQVAQFIASQIPGLNATNGTAYDGDPAIFAWSTTPGDADEGESITMGVPSVLESPGGPIFNRYVYHLSGSEPATSINTPTDIKLGKTTFATTENIVGSETAASIAQKIFDAMDAVDTDIVAVSKSGNIITVTTEGFRLAIALEIGDAGYDYTITQMVEV